MRIHYIQHVPFEGLGNIENWIKAKGHRLSCTRPFLNEEFASVSDFDWLIVMGGPMNIYQEDKYPWLKQEKKFIEEAIKADKIVLGICLGAQLIADVLGARVYRNQDTEIGWFPVSLTEEAKKSFTFQVLPQNFNAFHWHGDTFDIPSGAIHLAQSQGCMNQAFAYHERVLGLQFHLESSAASIKGLIEHGADEIVSGTFIQQPDEMLSKTDEMARLKQLNDSLLSQIEKL